MTARPIAVGNEVHGQDVLRALIGEHNLVYGYRYDDGGVNAEALQTLSATGTPEGVTGSRSHGESAHECVSAPRSYFACRTPAAEFPIGVASPKVRDNGAYQEYTQPRARRPVWRAPISDELGSRSGSRPPY